MYIKIKHIKQFLLVSACLFFAGFNYLTYVKADNATYITTCDKTIDTDCDGLTNAEEALYKTDPNNADTDGDGYSDGIEVKSGYDPTIPAPGDKIVDDSINSEINSNSPQAQVSMTDEVTQEIQGFIASKGNDSISSSDVQELLGATIVEKMGVPITWETLPVIDVAQLNILKQPYSTLKTEESKAKLQQDAANYIIKISYLLLSNAPEKFLTDNDLRPFAEEFFTRLSSFSTLTPDFEYFINIEDRLGLFSDQAKEIEAPETMLALHIKILGLTKGFSMLHETTPTNLQDPVANMVALSKIITFINLLKDFSENDLQNYINQIRI